MRKGFLILFLICILLFSNLVSAGLRIRVPRPYSNESAVFVGEERIFSIGNEDYEAIEWSLDGQIESNQDKIYSFKKDIPGNYTLQVIIYNQSENASKNWNIEVIEDDLQIVAFDVGTVVFYSLVAILIIIFLLIIYYMIIMIKAKHRKKSIPGAKIPKLKPKKTKKEKELVNEMRGEVRQKRKEKRNSIYELPAIQKIKQPITPVRSLSNHSQAIKNIGELNNQNQNNQKSQRYLTKRKRNFHYLISMNYEPF
jgi:hypothetical protein